MYNTYKLNIYNEEYDVYLTKSMYTNNRLAVILVTTEGKELVVITTNIPNHYVYKQNQSFIDSNKYEWLKDFLIKNNIAFDTNIYAPSGFNIYPLYEFNMNILYDYKDIINYINHEEIFSATTETEAEPEVKPKVKPEVKNKLNPFNITITDKNGTIVHQEVIFARSYKSAEKKARENYIKSLEVI